MRPAVFTNQLYLQPDMFGVCHTSHYQIWVAQGQFNGSGEIRQMPSFIRQIRF